MPPDQLDVPALPILVPLGSVLMAMSWVLLRRRGMLTVRRLGVAWIAGWYAVAVIGATLLPLHLAWGDNAGKPELYRIGLIPFVNIQVDDFLLNIVMTLPWAALFHVVFGIRDRRRVILATLLFSAVIEATQAVLVLTVHANRWAEVNDLMANTLGGWLGYLVFRRFMRFERFGRAVESCALARPDVRTRRAVR